MCNLDILNITLWDSEYCINLIENVNLLIFIPIDLVKFRPQVLICHPWPVVLMSVSLLKLLMCYSCACASHEPEWRFPHWLKSQSLCYVNLIRSSMCSLRVSPWVHEQLYRVTFLNSSLFPIYQYFPVLWVSFFFDPLARNCLLPWLYHVWCQSAGEHTENNHIK